jgi:hypothetical protein
LPRSLAQDVQAAIPTPRVDAPWSHHKETMVWLLWAKNGGKIFIVDHHRHS